MTDRRPDPVDDLLAGLTVPPLAADFTDRVVAEARRADRMPAPALAAPRPRRARRWTRRSAWTAVLAINLVLASAVAAALGSGAINAPHLIAAARHVVERLRHGSAASPAHHAAPHLSSHVRLRSVARPSSPPRYVVPPPAEPAFREARPPGGRVPMAERLRPLRSLPPAGARGFAHPARIHAAQQNRIRPAWRHALAPGAAARRLAPAHGAYPAGREPRFGAGQRFEHPAFHQPRFDRARMGPPRFRNAQRFREGRRFRGGRFGGGGGMRRGWRGRPRGRF